MNFNRFFPSRSLINHLTQQIRFFARDPFPNKLTQYLRRAELIDSIRVALRSGKPDSLPPLLNTRLLDSFVVTQVLRCAPSADSALSLIETLKKVTNFEHSQYSLHALATVLSKFKRNVELKTLIGAVSDGKFDNVRFSFMNLMKWYAMVGDLDSVLSTWKEYRNGDKRVCTESYNLVMQVYVEMGRNSEAVEVFRQMIDEGAIPNCRTYSVVIEHLVSLGKLDYAREVFSVLPRMRIKWTLKMFSVLVEAFVGVERYDEAKCLLIEMKEDGKFPSRTLRPCLERMKEAGYVEETNEFLEEMLPDERIRNVCGDSSDDDDEDENEDDGCDEEGDGDVDKIKLKPWLDPRALASALKPWDHEVVATLEGVNFVWTSRMVCKVLRNFKAAETAWSFFCWVASRPGFTHDVYTVERMITILARDGQAEMVDKLLDKVRAEGMKLSFSTIRLLIDFYGISKNADAALKVFRDDRELCGPISKFNLMILYSSLLRTLTKCKRDHDALDMLEEMISSGIVPDIQTFSGLISHFALQGDIRIVQKLFALVRQNGVEPDAYMYKVIIQAYCKCQRAALALRVFEDMMNSNLMPDYSTKELLLKSLWNEERRREAAAVEESCQKLNQVLPLVSRGHLWTVSSADLMRVYNIYSTSF